LARLGLVGDLRRAQRGLQPDHQAEEQPMKIPFKVHGVAEGRANVRAEVNGEIVNATVPCLEVELVTVSEQSGNLTLRFTGSQIEPARRHYTRDKIIEADFGETAEEDAAAPVASEPKTMAQRRAEG
jgi:hypothetical protein